MSSPSSQSIGQCIEWIRVRPGRFVIAFFAILFVVGLSITMDYGIPYDEATMDSLGRDAYASVFEGAPWPQDTGWRYHGTFIELPLMTIQRAFSMMGNPELHYRRIYLRHFACFFLYFATAVMVFVLGRRFFGGSWWGLLTVALFVLLPRIFAHGFYNSRDVPQIALFSLSMLTLLRLLDGRTYARAVLHGLAIACALSLRMSALIVLPITAVFLIVELCVMHEGQSHLSWKRALGLFATSVCATCIGTYALWPFLWPAPIAHFQEAYGFMSSLGGAATILGRTYDYFPWFYIPLWILVTIPAVVSLLCITGTVTSIVDICTHLRHPTRSNRNRMLLLCWLILPILAILFSGAGIYLEWRHVFFLAPAIVLLAAMGLRDILTFAENKKWLQRMVIGVLAVQMLATGIWMIRSHPFQYMYYAIPLKTAVPLFLDDYWALSHKQATLPVANQARLQKITMYSDENIAFVNMYTLYPHTLNTVIRVSVPDLAQFIVTRSAKISEGLTPLQLIQVDGVTINGVYKGPQYRE